MRKFYLFAYSPHVCRLLLVCLMAVTMLVGSVSPALASTVNQPQKKTVSVSFNGVSLEDVLQYLKKETGYYVLYNSNAVKNIKGIRLQKNNVSVNEVLNACLKGTNLTYTINDDTIVIKTKQEAASTPPLQKTDNSNDNKYIVMGTITNKATKAPLVGATAYVKGTNIGAIADEKGEYILVLDRRLNQTITYSLIGMESRDVVFTGQTHIDVELAEKVESIDDVVVTGYATIRKEGFTGNTTRITKDEILKVSQQDLIGAIQVFDPSFRITENVTMGSNPNSLPEFYIRGQNSVNMELSNTSDISRQNLTSNNNLPIFILDGFETTVEKIYDMDVNRIHSITLLKDAAATALYGSRAANGVIVIESRAPEAGKLRITYNLTGSVETPDLSAYNLMNAREKLAAEVNAGYYKLSDDTNNDDLIDLIPYYAFYIPKLNNVNRGVNTDWLSKGLQTAVNHKHSIYIDGGENDVRWGAELRYNGNNGVMKGSNRNTYGAGLFLDYRIGRFQIMNRLDYDIMDSKDTPYQDFSTYSHKQPYDVITDPVTGKYLQRLESWGGSGSETLYLNPLYEAAYLNSFADNKYNDITNKFAINYYATDNLTFKGTFSIEKKYSQARSFVDPDSYIFSSSSISPDYRGSLSITDGEYFSYNANLMAMYNKNIRKNYINLTVATELRETNTISKLSNYTGFASGALHSINNAARMDGKQIQSSNKTRLASFLFIGNYSYDDIYLLDASIRMDGSSEFGKDKKTAPFWASGIGINIHNYSFMKGRTAISRLKLRASYGQLGKVNFPVYAAISSYVASENWYLTGMGNMLQYLGNNELGWEKTNTFDVGLEFGMFEDRLLFKATYYDKKTIDMITSVTLPSSSGFTSYMDNMGKVDNRGFELDLRYNIVRNKNWDLTVFGNLSHNKNKILEISDALKAYNDLVDKQYADYDKKNTDSKYARTHTKFVEGGSTTSIFAMQSLGINPANGKELYLRPNGSVTYEWNAADMVIVGNTEPKAQGSFGFNARWKNFSIFTTFLYYFGGQKYNDTLVDYVENVNLLTSNADRRVGILRWQKEGDITPLKDIAESSLVTRPTSRFVQDDNVLQFNSLSISYDFNSKLIQKWGMSMLRLTASMEDLSYWSKIMQERGLSYPFSRTVNFSLNVTF